MATNPADEGEEAMAHVLTPEQVKALMASMNKDGTVAMPASMLSAVLASTAEADDVEMSEAVDGEEPQSAPDGTLSEEIVLPGQSFGGWRHLRSFKGVYTGGKMAQTKDGQRFVCLFNDDVVGSATSTLAAHFSLREANDGSDERFIMFAMDHTGSKIVTASDNQLLRTWVIGTEVIGGRKVVKPELKRSWKGHSGPVSSMDLHPLGQLVVTGSSDHTVKVWNSDAGFCTHNFRGHNTVVASVCFHPGQSSVTVASSDSSGVVRVWGLTAAVKPSVMTDHMSTVTCLVFAANGSILLTAGRDKVVNFWDVTTRRLLKTFAVFDAVETCCLLSDGVDEFTAAVGGDGGVVYVLRCSVTHGDGKTGALKLDCHIDRQENMLAVEDGQQRRTKSRNNAAQEGHIAQLLFDQVNDTLIATTWEQMILFLRPKDLSVRRRVIGHLDEVTDLQMLPSIRSDATEVSDASTAPSRLGRVALSTNTKDAYMLSLDTFDCTSLRGHTNTVLGVAVSRDGAYIATASRDNTARVFSTASGKCVSVCRGHTEPVNAVVFVSGLAIAGAGNLPPLVTCGDDKTLKGWTWKLPEAPAKQLQPSRKRARHGSVSSVTEAGDTEEANDLDGNQDHIEPSNASVYHTTLAHQKVINTVSVSPNGKMLATASQDKTAKLWTSDGLITRGSLKGHRRGVWDIQFSPVEMLVATSSADRTVRVWSVVDLSCLSTLEGHTASVLRVQFVRNATQLVSAASDGILKLWTLKSGEEAATVEGEHTERVWGLACGTTSANYGSNPVLMTGSGDAVHVWEDKADLERELASAKHEEELLAEQNLVTQMRGKDQAHAAILALRLNKPHTLQKILGRMLTANEKDGSTRESQMDDFVSQLNSKDVVTLWGLVADWNTIKRSSIVAHAVVERLLRVKVAKAEAYAIKKHIDALVAYSQRHADRLTGLLQSTFILDHALACMDPMSAPVVHDASSE